MVLREQAAQSLALGLIHIELPPQRLRGQRRGRRAGGRLLVVLVAQVDDSADGPQVQRQGKHYQVDEPVSFH